MADLRRIAPTRPSAQHISEDIGDVLGAIRRLIAEDEALVSARDRLKGAGASHLAEVPADPEAEDPAETLARRYGGNAALARQLAHLHDDLDFSAQGDDGGWPLGALANGPEAARPTLAVVPDAGMSGAAAFERVLAGIEAAGAGKAEDFPQPHNDLARRLSGSHADRDAMAEEDGGQPGETAPLRLDAGHMIAEHLPAPEAEAPVWSPLALGSATVESPVGFDADFDWKARMRPDPHDLSPASAGDAQEVQPNPAAAETAFVEVPLTAGAFPTFTPSLMAMPLAGAQMPLPPLGMAELSPARTEEPGPGQAAESPATEAPATDAPTTEPRADILGDEEQGIREMLREIIREELVGELGQRFSRNLRAVIRREVAVAIDDNLDRL